MDFQSTPAGFLLAAFLIGGLHGSSGRYGLPAVGRGLRRLRTERVILKCGENGLHSIRTPMSYIDPYGNDLHQNEPRCQNLSPDRSQRLCGLRRIVCSACAEAGATTIELPARGTA